MEQYYVYIYLEGSYKKCALLSYDGQTYQLAYGSLYLQRPNAVAIDPINLPLYERSFQSEEIFGALKDCSPDRWGRYLLEKKFNRELSEIEFILANGLDHVGALAFSPMDVDHPMRLTPGGYTLHQSDSITLDVIVEQTEMALKNESDQEKLQELLNYGPSLGGARPKYSVELNGEAYLAKYSVSQDTRREPLIEFASMGMAKALGLDIPEIIKGRVSNRDVFYIQRFDRDHGEKHPFVSALSLCGWDENGYQDWSYPLFCEALIKVGPNKKMIEHDLKELFQRVAFNIAVNNNDDHPRNHGVIYRNGTWRLSPAYDIVPMDSQTQSFSLAMEVGIQRRNASRANLLSAAQYFRLSQNQAEDLINKIFEFVSQNWKMYFKNAGLDKAEIQRFENAMRTKP